MSNIITPLPSQADLAAKAAAEAQAQIAAQQATVEAQRAAAARAAQAQQAAMQQAGQAVLPILQDIGPRVGAAYNDAAQTLGGISGAFSEEMRARIAAANAANESFAASQGLASSPGVDPTKAKDTMHYLGGYVPSASLAQQGAAARTRAEAQPAIAVQATRVAVQDLMRQGNEKDMAYVDQLNAIAREFPELKAQAQQRLEEFALNRWKAQQDVALSSRQVKVQEDAQKLYAKQFGETVRKNKAQEQLEWAGLSLRSAADRAAIKKEAARGREVDSAASKLYGYIVDKNGRPITRNGKNIPIKATADPDRQKALDARSDALSGVRTGAFEVATELRGKPVVNERQGILFKGKYMAKPGAKGVFVRKGVRTTNNPRLAARDGEGLSFAEALERAWASVDGDGVSARYGIPRSRVRQMVRQALIRAGWKPDGRRP